MMRLAFEECLLGIVEMAIVDVTYTDTWRDEENNNKWFGLDRSVDGESKALLIESLEN